MRYVYVSLLHYVVDVPGIVHRKMFGWQSCKIAETAFEFNLALCVH